MKSLASRVAALEKQHKQIAVGHSQRWERFTGEDGNPWVRYFDGIYSVELPCNGRDDPLDWIFQRVEAGEEKPEGLSAGESEAWNGAIYKKIGERIVQRILAGEVMPEDLSPNERECWELVEAVREKY